MSSIDRTIEHARTALGHPDVPVFDPDAARARLADARGPVFWRSLEELSDDAGFRRWLHTQHPQLAESLRMDRRGFLKLLGASLALAGLAGCGRPPSTEMVPYVHGVPGQTDALPRFFASAWPGHGYATGVLVESNMGRPTKIEGNPGHPASLGATDIFAQAAILQLWDPDRSQSVRHDGVTATWDDFDAALQQVRARRHGDGKGLRILSGNITSPTLSAQLDTLLKQYPGARWHLHEPGLETALPGSDRSVFYRLDRARVIVSLDGDFLRDTAAGTRYARDFAAGRSPDGPDHDMSRLYVIEPTPTLTGSMADHRLPLSTRDLHGMARRLARRLGVSGYGQGRMTGVNEADASRWLDAMLGDLEQHRGRSLVVVGATQPAWMHALGRAMNAALGNHGKTVIGVEAVARQPGPVGTLEALARDMHAGRIDTLLVLDSNPVYDAPGDLAFADALAKVPHVIHVGLYHDETGRKASWHAPLAHPLESWGDARAYDGIASIMQPLIAPLHGGRAASEVLARLCGDSVTDAAGLVRRQWRHALADDEAWKDALRSGVVPGSGFQAAPLAAPGAHEPAADGESDGDDALELLFRPDPTIDDGRWANNGWLQELPKPLTRLTWGNPALISPALAEERHLTSGDVVELRIGGHTLRMPVWVMPGQARRSVTVYLGYGRRAAGHVGDGQGVDVYPLRHSRTRWRVSGLTLHATGEHRELAGTQHHFNMEGRDLLRVGTLAAYLDNPAFATADDRFPDPPPSLYKDQPPGQYAWGMSIDLNACIGCGACTIACQAENNIPVVGKEQVQRGREMHWIRVDRYFEGGPDDPRSYAQPVPCQMCENAPCEVVCPVDATVHDDEGLNVQVYNRCVGTRFCSNNCPYKVRRFNFLQYADKTTDELKAQRNPEVSVRRRGVMEKCTYCIQRIQNAHITADREGRRIGDGEVVTACQAVCGARAIRFGDQADPHSEVARAKALPRDYAMLGELGTRPHTTYLARLRNPHPNLEDAS